MRFLSLFSGIEAASVAWLPMGWECVAVAEIEPFCCAALTHYYPSVPNLGSVTEITKQQVQDLGHIDVVVFGFPCQDLSVAGKRKGLKDDDGTPTRSGLFFNAMRIVEWSGARWALAENVPGLFSSNGGRDFAAVVGEMAGADIDVPQEGWQNTGVATGESGLVEWCVLDAQWFGVPQRRRRVFLVRDTGDWRSRPPLLFDSESLSGNPPPSREAGAGVAHTLARGACGSHGRYDPNGEDFVVGSLACNTGPNGHDAGNFACNQAVDAGHVVATALRARDATKGVDSDCTDTLVTGPLQAHSKEHGHAMTTQQAVEAGQVIPIHNTDIGTIDRDRPRDGAGIGEPGDPMFTLGARAREAIAFDCKQSGEGGEVSPPLRALSHDKSHANAGGQVAVAYRTSGNSGVMEQGDKTAALNCNTDPTQQIIGVPFVVAQNGSDIQVGDMPGAVTAGQAKQTSGDLVAIPIDMRQASRGGKMTNNRKEGSSGGPPGTGIGKDGDASPSLAESHTPAVAFQPLQPSGIMQPTMEVHYANAQEARSAEALCLLRKTVGEEAMEAWSFGILAAFWPQEVLRPEVHGKSLRRTRWDGRGLVDGTLPRPKEGAERQMRGLWQAGCQGRRPHRWKPPEQLARELAAYLSELPQQEASREAIVRCLWKASEGIGVLRQALSAIQEVGKPVQGEAQPAHRITNDGGLGVSMAVRRLTPT